MIGKDGVNKINIQEILKKIENDAIKDLELKKPLSDDIIKNLEYKLSIANYTIGVLMVYAYSPYRE